MKKAYLAKLKDKMPSGKKVEEEEDLFSLPEGEPEEGETEEHEAAESPEFEAGEHEEMEEGYGGIPEGTPEEEAAETEEAHTAELSDDALLKELEKRGLHTRAPKVGGKGKAVQAPKGTRDVEEKTGY